MAEVDTIDIPDVTPVTRTVATMSKLIKTAGLPADAASTATDTTSVTHTSIFKQISKSVQLMMFGAGTAAAAQRMTLASDDPAVATLGATSGAKVITDANGTIQQYLRGLVSLWIGGLAAGSAIIGKVGIDQTTDGTTNKVRAILHDGTTAGKVLPASTVPVAADPAIIVAISPNGVNANIQNGAPCTIVAQTPTAVANGLTASRVNAAASTNATNLKASAGQLYEIDVFNVAAYNVFLKLYNKASAPTVGTDTPVITIPIQAGGGYARTFQMGRTFATGISYAITKLQADSDTTVVVAGDLTGSIGWM